MKIGKIKITRFNVGLNVFTPDFYLNEGKMIISDLIDKGVEYKFLYDVSDKLYQGGIFKRVFVNSPEKAHLYITATDMVKSQPIANAKYISKKYTPWVEEMTLRNKQILVSCAGTVGNTALVNDSFEECIGSQEIIRIETSKIPYGYLYAYLSTPLVNQYIQSMIYGAVIPRISPSEIGKLPILLPSEAEQQIIHDLIVEAAALRVEASELLRGAKIFLKKEANLEDLDSSNYEAFGSSNNNREVSMFSRNIQEISSLTINAFNYSKRVEELQKRVKQRDWRTLSSCLDYNSFFSSGSFKRLEIDSPNSIKLINQSDIFNTKKQGKLLARKFVNADRLVEYGEVIIAGVGTLGESETFCRAIFANEELEGQLISGEFIRMKTNGEVPSGYLFCWLSTDYGFRFIRSTQTGTKLCRPIQALLKEIPVPILDQSVMDKIDADVTKAYTKMYKALLKENQAISLIEQTIDSWQLS